ncbi:MAG TPA: XdhC family protein [Nocardioides sp.]|jgi:xanthine dehydrogenase accessory factor
MTEHLTGPPSVRLLIVGAGPVTDALVPMASALGWAPTVASSVSPEYDAVVVTSHDDGVDGPAIKAALTAEIEYVGAMGSRRTQARRRDWLLANGLTDADLEALHAPIGLDIGADEPGEIAVSILAEIVAVRRGAGVVGSVSARTGPIHPELAEGEAYCPGG